VRTVLALLARAGGMAIRVIFVTLGLKSRGPWNEATRNKVGRRVL
jgi:hypothetical protein